MRQADQQKAGAEKPHRPVTSTAGLLADIAEMQARLAELPSIDDRSPEEIIGYDESGLPT